jgi:hypothetical protein
MKKSKCPQCGSKTKSFKQKYKSTKTYAGTNRPIILDAHYIKCNSKKCGFAWLPADEAENIEGQISRLSWNTLDSEQWALIRDCLGFKTKTKASRFLGLNDKAFSKYERGYSDPNLSIDLLVRLVIHSHENFRFIKNLHKKDFKFDPKDYQLVCEKTGDNWMGAKTNPIYFSMSDTLHGTAISPERSQQVPPELLLKGVYDERSYY